MSWTQNTTAGESEVWNSGCSFVCGLLTCCIVCLCVCAVPICVHWHIADVSRLCVILQRTSWGSEVSPSIMVFLGIKGIRLGRKGFYSLSLLLGPFYVTMRCYLLITLKVQQILLWFDKTTAKQTPNMGQILCWMLGFKKGKRCLFRSHSLVV